MRSAAPHTGSSLSVIIPVFNESENVVPLIESVHDALADRIEPWELILVDDGSMDDTVSQLRIMRERFGSHIRIVELSRNFGQTAALQAGLDQARGDLVALLDGDLQNDPRDIPAMLDKLQTDDLEAVVGWRRDRQDGYWLRRLPSKIANRLIGRVTGIHLHDYGCTLKVFRADTIRDLRLFGEMHRFIPAWIAMRTKPSKIVEMPVRHHPRIHGESKYGISRTFRVLIDLMVVFFFMRYRTRPGHFFGMIGFVLGGTGSVMLGYLLVLKLFGQDIGLRPMFLTAVLLVMLSVQLLTTAVMSELLSRVYFETKQQHGYQVGNQPDTEETAWRRATPTPTPTVNRIPDTTAVDAASGAA